MASVGLKIFSYRLFKTDLDEKGIAKTAREEKLRARDELKKKAEHDRMMRHYRQHVLKEPAPVESPVQLVGLGSGAKAEPAETTH